VLHVGLGHTGGGVGVNSALQCGGVGVNSASQRERLRVSLETALKQR